MNATRLLVSLISVICLVSTARTALPTRKYDVNDVVEKVIPATDAEKKAGVLVTIFVKGPTEGIRVTKDTRIHRQMGKLVSVVEPGDIKEGLKVSVWVNNKAGVAEGVLIFPLP